MNKQNKIIVGVVALILALTIGYAVFSQSLNIKGTAKAEGSLDIVFSEVGKITQQGAEIPTTKILQEGKELEINGTVLNYPTAYVNIPVTIVNNGTVDGVLEGITVENLETDDIKVTINGIEEKQIVKVYKENDETTKVKAVIKIEWLDKVDTKTDSVKNIVITLNAKQLVKEVVTTSSSASDNNCTEFTKKDTYEVGDVIAFCNTNTGKSEDFYIIKDNGDTVTALAKYNLMVGNKIVRKSDFSIESTTKLTSDDKDYGLQSELTKMGVDSDGMPESLVWYGVTAFSDKDESNKETDCTRDYCYFGYWSKGGYTPLEKYGTSYPSNVYDENSLLWTPVQNYRSYFSNTLNKNVSDMRLITFEELTDLGCTEGANSTCTYDFVNKNLGYWSTAAYSKSGIWCIYIQGNLSYSGFMYGDVLGVRPVITINKSEI